MAETVLLKEIKNILKEFPQYWDKEALLKSRVVEDLRNYQPELIISLLTSSKIKEQYEVVIGNTTIFKIEEFIQLLSYKDFWEDSYTKYSNKIGLTSGGKYLDYNSDVVLDFPFKDCVLEGGMTKEEVGKKEIYYNKVIARDEVDSLLEPKVFTNTKKYTKDSEEVVSEITDTDNLIIKGNNLLALHTLKGKFTEKVSFIYIDPPYYFAGKQENDSFDYNPDFKLSSWLTFMENRISVALSMLKDDGYLAIQINDYGVYHLKVLLDEMFHSLSNGGFVNDIVVKMSDLSGPKMAHADKKIPKIKEHILLYSKDLKKGKLNEIKIKSTWNSSLPRYNSFIEKNNSNDSNNWTFTTVRKKLEEEGLKYDTEEGDNYLIENHELVFRTAVNKSLEKMSKELQLNPNIMNKIVSPTGLEKYVYKNEEVLFASTKIAEINGKMSPVESISDMWLDIALNDLSNEGGVVLKNGKKPELLLKRLIELTTDENDIVLDFFMGSATTQAVAMKMNRQFIGIEQMDYINNKSVARLINVINGEGRGISKDVNWNGGGSFIYTELMDLNNKYIKLIQEAPTSSQLLELLEEIKGYADLNYLVELDKLSNEPVTIGEDTKETLSFSELDLAKQKQLLIDVMDINQLYVNYSEIDDADYQVSEDDKTFNRSFYEEGDN